MNRPAYALAGEARIVSSSSDSAGPLTSGPVPVDHSASVACSVRPAMRFLEPISAS